MLLRRKKYSTHNQLPPYRIYNRATVIFRFFTDKVENTRNQSSPSNLRFTLLGMSSHTKNASTFFTSARFLILVTLSQVIYQHDRYTINLHQALVVHIVTRIHTGESWRRANGTGFSSNQRLDTANRKDSNCTLSSGIWNPFEKGHPHIYRQECFTGGLNS